MNKKKISKEEFIKFFKPYSQNVDIADNSAFWKLSDAIIRKIILKNIPAKSIKENDIIMDAGGGTGRWVCKLSQDYKCRFILYDLSDDMLEKAKKNISRSDIQQRVTVTKGDLTNINQIETGSVDCIISIYSPISFIYDKEKATKEMYRVLKKGGVIIIMGHGYYNALYSKMNNYFASIEEIGNIEKDYTVKWANHVPFLNVFSKESMEKLLSNAGFKIEKTYGIPVFIQPGLEDFDPKNKQRSQISKALENKKYFKNAFKIEMAHNSKPTVVNRGMNIFTAARK
ncbi:MAG: class I SAM-dependent methyltransferase [Candidatus Moranbacteria bacterium]|nr:class I SAM-dependent methyltransferase [Candidatus Moranbacteria bacterium]